MSQTNVILSVLDGAVASARTDTEGDGMQYREANSKAENAQQCKGLMQCVMDKRCVHSRNEKLNEHMKKAALTD